MDAVAVAGRYFDAWNDHDPAAIAAVFAPDGTYTDPTCPGGLTPDGTAEYAAGLFAAFPDLAFEVGGHATGDGGLVSATWRMTGTNTGAYMGLPPTGRTVELRGVDVIGVADDGLRSVEGYFDTRALPDQLGLQVIVQPAAIGPFSFGTSAYAGGDDAEPGAVSLTVLEARSPEQVLEVRERTREVIQGLLATPGLIGWIGATIGMRMYTITAWRSAEDVAALHEDPAHRDAMSRFFGTGLAKGGQTGVWRPHHLNGRWTRCDGCGEMVRAQDDATCACGAELTPFRYW